VNTKVKKMIIIIQRFICALENPEFLLRTWKTLENPGIDFFCSNPSFRIWKQNFKISFGSEVINVPRKHVGPWWQKLFIICGFLARHFG